MYRRFGKRIFDVIFTFLLLLLNLPVFLLICIALLFLNKGDIFFVQRRPGKDGELFSIIKFKTMYDEAHKYKNPMSEEERITFVGSILRHTHLDELPQLLNVLKGEMSLIGPRPLLPEYLQLYDNVQQRRHLVKPGITGWAQVSGQNTTSWHDVFLMDLWYVEHVSLKTDGLIFFLTVKKIMKEIFMPSREKHREKFTGNN